MDTLRIAIIGAGYFGQLHSSVFKGIPNAKVTAVMNRSIGKAEDVAREHGARACSTLEELFSLDDFDAVSICVPEAAHADTAIYCAGHKKHILLEKPIATCAADARRIQKAAKDNGVRLMVAHVLKFDPRYVQLGDAVKSGQLGEISSAYVRRNGPRAVGERFGGKVSFLHYLAVHDIEWMLDYMGSRPVSVYAQYSNKVNADFDGKDTMFAVVKFENNSIGCIETCWAMPNNAPAGLFSSVRLIGTKGMGSVDGTESALSIITPDGAVSPDLMHWPYYNGLTQGALKGELEHFVNATLTGAPYLVDTESAIAAVGVIDACFRSFKSGMPENILY